jgi:hypothetical protein
MESYVPYNIGSYAGAISFWPGHVITSSISSRLVCNSEKRQKGMEGITQENIAPESDMSIR